MRKAIIAVLSLMLLAGISSAATINFNPNGFSSHIWVGSAGKITNGQAGVYELSNSSTHQITLGWAGSGTNHFKIHIDENGIISSDTTRASIIDNNITLHTTPIIIDPGLFLGKYHLANYLSGIQTLMLVAEGTGQDDTGSRYVVQNGAPDFRIEFNIDVNGNTSSTSTRLTLEENKLTFITTPIEIDAGLYKGDYHLAKYFKGNKTVDLIIGGNGSMDFGNNWSLGNGMWPWYTKFEIDINGKLSTSSTRISVSGNAMTLLTTPIEVEPNLYSGRYHIAGYYSGHETIHLLRTGTGADDTGDVWAVGNGSWPFSTKFHLDSEGNVSTDSTRVNAVGSTLSFNTIQITFNPYDFSEKYAVAGLWWTGLQILNLMPEGLGEDDNGSRYRVTLENGTFESIDIKSPCAILPSENIVIGESDSAVQMNISCEQPILDSDEDGVADTADNCPTVANEDQLDQDIDGVGNICDSDLDGDLIENSIDNCPDFTNANQSDLDGDLIGDSCDDDLDGDTISDTSDNCPLINNINQADNDLDSFGDACDADDDNDSIADIDDNCPNHSNFYQLDSDYDGAGDICDGDGDGDGIGNDLDHCPLTPISTTITQDGCNAEQHLAIKCSPENSPNHGKYVSCVAEEAKNLVDIDLITSKEKSRYVTQAARSK